MLNRAGFAMVVAATALAFAPVTAQAQNCGTIELGAAVSATGIYAANGKNTKNGYEFAVKKINDAGGVKIGGKCYHFKIKYYDDELTPARAAQLVERLIDQDKINYVLGPYGSPLTKAILPVIEKYKTPLVQGEAASRSLFTQGYKYHFGIVATSEKYLTPVVDMAADIAKKAGKDPSKVKIAMIYQDDAFSLDVRQGVVDAMKKYKMSATVDDRMPKDLNDITSFMTKVKALKPDVLIVSGHEKGAATAARQMAELQIQVPLVGMTHCELAKMTQDFPKASEDFVCPTQWDETMKAGDKMFGTAANYNIAIKAAYRLQDRAVSDGAGGGGGLCLGGCVQARQFARQGKAARGADQDGSGNLLRARQVCRRRQQSREGNHPAADPARQIQRRVAGQSGRRQAELSARGSVLSIEVEAGIPSARFRAFMGARPAAIRSGDAFWLFAAAEGARWTIS